jgi:hypothetical protein
LPGYIEFPFLKEKTQTIKDVSLVVREAKQSSSHVRQVLGFPLDAQILLITLGGFDLQGTDFESWTQDRIPPGWFALIASPNQQYLGTTDRLKFIKSDTWFMPGISFSFFYIFF